MNPSQILARRAKRLQRYTPTARAILPLPEAVLLPEEGPGKTLIGQEENMVAIGIAGGTLYPLMLDLHLKGMAFIDLSVG